MRVILSFLCLLICAPDQDDIDDERKARRIRSQLIVAQAADPSPFHAAKHDLPSEVQTTIDAWLRRRGLHDVSPDA